MSGSGDITCEECVSSKDGEPALPAEGFHVQALPFDVVLGARSRLRPVCRRHRGKLMQYQFVPLDEGWRQYVLQEVMES